MTDQPGTPRTTRKPYRVITVRNLEDRIRIARSERDTAKQKLEGVIAQKRVLEARLATLLELAQTAGIKV